MNPAASIKKHFTARAHEARRETERHGAQTRRRGYLGAAFHMSAAAAYGAGAVIGAGVTASTVIFLPDIYALPLVLPLAASLAGSTALLGVLAANSAADGVGQWQAARNYKKPQPA